MPNALELPRVLRAVIPLVRGERLPVPADASSQLVLSLWRPPGPVVDSPGGVPGCVQSSRHRRNAE